MKQASGKRRDVLERPVHLIGVEAGNGFRDEPAPA